MKTWARRSILAVALLVAVAAALSAAGVWLYRGTPGWYQAERVTDADRARLAQSAENKLIDAQNWAAAVRADSVRANRAAGGAGASARPGADPASPAPRAGSSHEVTFTQQELNALFDKWSVLYGWRDRYAEYLEDPRVVLHNGMLILAGKLTQLRAVASFQFRPSIDDAGRLRLDLVRVTGGRLPLPDAVWVGWRDKIVAALRERVPQWRQEARIDPSGAANFPAMAATLSRLLFSVADRRPAEPVLFFPLADGGGESVPVRVAAVGVEDGKLTLNVAPLTAAERAALLAKIKSAAAAPTPAPPAGTDAQASGR